MRRSFHDQNKISYIIIFKIKISPLHLREGREESEKFLFDHPHPHPPPS
jgi:hypothetical protein